jgi:uroporphyrinogen-III synthase
MPDDSAALAGLRVVAFEARRAGELVRMLERHGATVLSAPALREAALPAPPAVRELAHALERGEVDTLVLMTGVGTRALARRLEAEGADSAGLLRRTRVVARGPKPVTALREMGITTVVAVPAPNTWREVLAVLDGLALPAGRLVAVQEYGIPPRALYEGLAARGQRVLAVPVYEWALPEDPGPLAAGVAAVGRGEVDVAVFTSGVQVEHAFRVAGDAAAFGAALARVVVASVGPVCSETLDAHGVAVDLEATPPKMGPLVARVAAEARGIVERKRRDSAR